MNARSIIRAFTNFMRNSSCRGVVLFNFQASLTLLTHRFALFLFVGVDLRGVCSLANHVQFESKCFLDIVCMDTREDVHL